MEQNELLQKILDRLNDITGKSGRVPDETLEPAVFQRLDQVEKIVSSIQRYLPKRVIDKILLNPEGVKVEGERRPVTVLFGDLSGFTAMSETMDPEQVVEVVNQYFDTMVEIAERYGGHIDKFMGDALMVLFGAPVVHEDDALRACLAAVEMLEAMDRFSAERKMDLAMSIGLNSGEVVALNVGSKGRMEYTVMGDGVNLAARLEKVATARQCVIGENTYKQVKGKIRLKKLKPVMVKGKSKPQNVYLILGRVETAESAAGLRAGSIKMVGRMAEMDIIRQSVEQVKAGNGRVVAISGGPGIGKSRLAKELELLARDEGFRFVKGKCYSYAQSAAYLPFLRQLHLFLEIQEKDSLEKKRERLMEKLQSLDLSEYEPFLGLLLGIPNPEIEALDPQKRKRKTFEGFENLFHKLSDKGYLAIAFEDLQWADSLSLELLEHLVTTITGKPILFCCDFRAELALPFASQPWCVNIELGKLDAREVMQMVSGLANVADVSDAILDKVAERTEGNPLFIEEITRHLLSRRLVKRDNQQLIAAKKFGAMALPATVAGVVLGRIDKLSEELRRTTQYAAVIGKEFDRDILAHITKTPPDQLQRQLDNLEQTEGLLYSKEIESKRLYQFHSNVTQEAAYSTLLKQRRQELHGRVAQTYEREYKENLAPWLEDLAHHYFLSPYQDKAAVYLHRAGDKARGLYANAAAIEYYDKATGVLKKARKNRESALAMAEVLGAQGAIYRLIGQRDKALANFTSAAKIAQREKELLSEWKYLLESGIVYDMLGQVDKARETLNIILYQAENKGVDLVKAMALNNNGDIFLRGGKTEEAINYFTKALSIYQNLKEEKESARASGSLGKAYELIGDIPKAIEYYQSAINISEKINYLEGIAIYGNNLGQLYIVIGEMADADKNFIMALHMARKIGDKRIESYSSGNMGIMSALAGNYNQALENFELSFKAASEMGDLSQQKNILDNIGSVYQIWGNPKLALENHQAAFDIATKIKDTSSQAEISRNLSLDYTLLGNYRQALHELSNAIQVAAEVGDPRMQAYIKANMGALCHNLGQLEQADKNINEALDEARKVRDPEVILAAARALVEFKLETGDLPSAEEHVNRLLGLAEKTQNKREMAYGLLNLADLLFHKQELIEMSGPLSEALTLAQELKDKILLGRIYLLFAQKALANKNIKEADDYLKDANEMAQKTNSPDLLWQVHYYLGKSCEMKENREQAGQEFESAKSLIREMQQQLPDEFKNGFIENTQRKIVFDADIS